MWAFAVACGPAYGPLAFPVAPVASSAPGTTVLVWSTESPTPGWSATATVGVAV